VFFSVISLNFSLVHVSDVLRFYHCQLEVDELFVQFSLDGGSADLAKTATASTVHQETT
jgi:hypothetical protein